MTDEVLAHHPYQLIRDGDFGNLKAGETVFLFKRLTYGCIGPDGVAMSRVDGDYPFFEVARDNLIDAEQEPS